VPGITLVGHFPGRDDGLGGRVQVQPDDVTDLGLEFRVGGELEGVALGGLQLPFAPDPRDLAKEIPNCRASRRADQCVTPSQAGGGSSVAVTTATWSAVGGRPECFPSASALMPPVSNRLRQCRTVGRDTPTHRLISVFEHTLGREQHDPFPLRQPGSNEHDP
jgi:hypothetical protein